MENKTYLDKSICKFNCMFTCTVGQSKAPFEFLFVSNSISHTETAASEIENKERLG